MTKRIYGGYDVTHNATALGKRTVQSIDGTALFDANGNMDLDGYTKNELTEIVGVIPLSHYGSHNYLPAGVSGDFVGASENPNYRRVKHLLEDDGTLVMLRAGTNGSENGLYYSYLSDALNKTVINDESINSNKQYKPGYIPSNVTPVGAVSSNDGVVVGVCQVNGSTSTSTDFFTSLTNGTLDDAQHVGFMIPSSTVLPGGGELVFAMLGEDGLIYYFGMITTGSVFELSVVQVNYNQAANTFTSTRLTGFSGSLFYSMSASTNIKLAGQLMSSLASDQPYWLIPNGIVAANTYMVAYDLFAKQDASTKNIRIRLNGDAYISAGYADNRPQHGFSFVLNPSTKAVTLDSGYLTTANSPAMTSTIAGTVITTTGNVVNTDSLYDHNGSRNVANTYNYTHLNTVICISVENLQRPPLMQIVSYNTTITPYQMLDYKKYTSNLGVILTGKMYESYGSVVGSYLTGLELLAADSTKQLSTSPDGTVVNSYAKHGTATTFAFSSNNYGTITGYEPLVDRAQIANDNAHKMFISSVTGTAVNANGGVFVQGLRESTALSYDGNGNGTGTMSINGTALLNFKNSEVAKMTTPLDTTSSTDCVVYVPQQAYIPAFAVISAVSTDFQYVYRFVEVNVNTRTGNITTISFKKLIEDGVRWNTLMKGSNGRITDSSTGATIYDGGSFYFVGFADPVVRRVVGNDVGFNYKGIVDKSTATFTAGGLYSAYTSYSSNTIPFALPGQGFGYALQIDDGCKMGFFSCGTTIADYNAWTPKSAKPINVVSQDVAKGFIVYFTEETPVLLSGKSFTLPITTIDLTTITANPANKTFYVYVRMVQGVATYDITQEVIAETGTTAYNLFWIGTIKTNALQIDSIDVRKRSRLDIFGESLEAAGSSFPVSYGMPSSTGNIHW